MLWGRLTRTPISQKLSERFSLNSPSFKVLTSPKFDQNFIGFKTLVRILESFETNEILVKLRTGQDLETGRV